MALPRRPYLLGLFPGTSIDWAIQDSTGKAERERRRQNVGAREGGKEKYIIRSHAHIEFKQQGEKDFETACSTPLQYWGHSEKLFKAKSKPRSSTGGCSKRLSVTGGARLSVSSLREKRGKGCLAQSKVLVAFIIWTFRDGINLHPFQNAVNQQISNCYESNNWLHL